MKTMVVKVAKADPRDWYHSIVGKQIEVSREISFQRAADGTEQPIFNCVKQQSGNVIPVANCKIIGSHYHVTHH
jgi:hypothetical protein